MAVRLADHGLVMLQAILTISSHGTHEWVGSYDCEKGHERQSEAK